MTRKPNRKKMIKEINNLNDLRYRKLYLRSEIKLKEQKIGNQVGQLKTELNTADFKNEIIKSAMNNPVMVINIARIAFEFVTRFRKYGRKKKAKGKDKKS